MYIKCNWNYPQMYPQIFSADNTSMDFYSSCVTYVGSIPCYVYECLLTSPLLSTDYIPSGNVTTVNVMNKSYFHTISLKHGVFSFSPYLTTTWKNDRICNRTEECGLGINCKVFSNKSMT